MPQEPRKKKTMFGNLRPQDVKALGIGLELSAVIGGFAYGGYWLDERWGTGPLMLFVGLFIGLGGGSWHTIKVVNGGKVPDFGFKRKQKGVDKQPNETSEGGDKPKS